MAPNSFRLEVPGGIPSSPVTGSEAWSRTGRPCGPGSLGEAPSCGQSHGVRKKGLGHSIELYIYIYVINENTLKIHEPVYFCFPRLIPYNLVHEML